MRSWLCSFWYHRAATRVAGVQPAVQLVLQLVKQLVVLAILPIVQQAFQLAVQADMEILVR